MWMPAGLTFAKGVGEGGEETLEAGNAAPVGSALPGRGRFLMSEVPLQGLDAFLFRSASEGSGNIERKVVKTST